MEEFSRVSTLSGVFVPWTGAQPHTHRGGHRERASRACDFPDVSATDIARHPGVF